MSDKKKILIVEDDRPISNILNLKLSKAGYETEIAYDGQEGLDKISKDSFNLIILDLMMPVKDGFEVLQELKDKGVSTPVIIMSNLSQEEDVEKAKNLGAKDYFIKSNIDLKEIVKQIEKWIK